MARASRQVDVAIVGAGPAGSSAAIALARAGRSVLLIERQSFPRQKVCGGCLSGPAVVHLRELLGPDRPPPGTAGSQITFVIGTYRLTCRPRGLTWVVPRDTFDAFLAESAVEAGVEVRYGEPARLERGDRGLDMFAGEDRIRAGTVLVASGLGGLASTIGVQRRGPAPSMIAQQWVQPADTSSPPIGGVELHWLRGGYVGLAAPDANHCVVALAARADTVAGCNTIQELRRLNPRASVWDLLHSDAPQRYGARGTAGFPWIPDRLGDANALLIGDAAGYSEPFSGAGIGAAMHSARCAVDAILGGVDILQRYTLLMRSHRRSLERTRMLSRLLNFVVSHVPSHKALHFLERKLSPWVEQVHIRGAL